MSFDFAAFTEKSQKAIDHIRQEIGVLRTGRASVDMLDTITVDAYGQRMKLVEVASVSAPDPTLLLISPWDKSLIEAIERAIAISNLELNPVVDGHVVRIPIAPLTEDRRKEMVKVLQRRLEDGRVLLRGIRTETKKEIEEQKGNAGISEDDIASDLESLEKNHRQFMDMIDQMGTAKEKELLTL